MADDPLTEAPGWPHIIAERRGITRALALVPGGLLAVAALSENKEGVPGVNHVPMPIM